MKQPKYFKYWTWLSYGLIAISGIPLLLVQFNIILPQPFATLSNKFVSGVGTAMFIMSKLAVKTPIIAQTEAGQAVNVLNIQKMPFTAKTEAKEVSEENPAPPILEDLPNLQ